MTATRDPAGRIPESVYRLIVETMREAALATSFEGRILFCNASFSELVKRPPDEVVGRSLLEFVDPGDAAAGEALLVGGRRQPIRQRLVFRAADGSTVPAHVSAAALQQLESPCLCVVATALAELERSIELVTSRPAGLALEERAQEGTAERAERAALRRAPVRVLLADDHAVVREGLRLLLELEPDIEIVGEARDGHAAVEMAGRLRPDVVLMDIGMPNLDGVDATRAIRTSHPDVRVIGLSMFEDGQRIRAILEAGAVRYVSKSGPPAELIAAVLACADEPAGEPAGPRAEEAERPPRRT